jgi:hypothetical protein
LLIDRLYRTLAVIAVVFSALGAAAQSKGNASIEVAVVKPHPSAVMHNNFKLCDEPLRIGRSAIAQADCICLLTESASDCGRVPLGFGRPLGHERQNKSEGRRNAPAGTADRSPASRERFGLQFHREKRELPSYALQVEGSAEVGRCG